MKRTKPFTLIILIVITAVFLASCATKSFSSTLSCNELSKSLKGEISSDKQEFTQYTEEEIRFLFPSFELYDDATVIYSNDSVDITEVGVLHASSEKHAHELLEDAKDYIHELQEQKREFLQSYSPTELLKLNSAEAKRFGQYVVFVIAEQGDVDKVFKKAEMLLTK